MRAGLLPLAAAWILGCGRNIDPPPPPGETIAPETFATALAELAVARVETLPDTIAYRARRDRILARYDVSEGELRAFGRAFAPDETVMQRVYGRVRQRIDAAHGSGAATPAAADSPAAP